MTIFTFDHYKDFVRAWIASRPKNGRGLYQQMATHLRMHRTTVSQVFGGEKHLTYEQASDLCDFLELTARESLYFLNLVQIERAGSAGLKRRLVHARKQMQDESRASTGPAGTLSSLRLQEIQHVRFYSDWLYSGIRVMCSIPEYKDAESISARLGVKLATVKQAISFLREANLIRIAADGSIEPNENLTYLAPDSPFVNSHRRNWRLKALGRLESLGPDELAFSAPVSVSEELFGKFQRRLRQLIEELYGAVRKDTPEVPVIFNVDWVRF